MAHRTKCLLIFLLITFFLMQWKLTLFGGFFWPFSSHRLFSQQATEQKSIVQARLVDARGVVHYVHPGRVIPIEYSRCSGLVRKLAKEREKKTQEAFIAYLLFRLNSRPWHAFDEMFSPAQSPTAAPFVELSFETHDVDFFVGSYPNSPVVIARRPLFP